MSAKKTSDSQLGAINRYDEKNPEAKRKRIAKSTAKRYITKLANEADLEEVKHWLDEAIDAHSKKSE
ncbi:hypothetical protein HCJ39_07145 [Listeria rocourtiae]|uniref:hypothetical protein n=1 Tax=Listeria rocourtiae TaxID=647910 RepID=UPI00162556E5|nr:hypothetical protein [Listeria rocourtiae]MBC1604486.1 hypothetical protein [Listeria rocourtiae]